VDLGSIVDGKYLVERIIGEGGMGRVVEATHIDLEQKVAIKHLRPEVMARSEAVHRFLREARAAVRLRSEHVARVLDVGIGPSGVPYMVMELLDGKDLATLLREDGPVPSGVAVGWVLQACEAIAEAHGMGIVHRDIKPGNLFLTGADDGSDLVKVLDFGISKARQRTDEDFSLTRTSSLMGSPGYMSPEQLRAPRDVDARGDIWSIGVVLYELLEGRVPFEAEVFSELCIKVAMDPLPPLVRTPPGLAHVVIRCLEKDPAARWKDVAALADALVPYGPPGSAHRAARMRRLLGGRVRPGTAPRPAPAPPMSSTLDTASGSTPTQPQARRRVPVLVAAAAATAVAGITIWLTVARDRARTAVPPSPPHAQRARAVVPASAPPPVVPVAATTAADAAPSHPDAGPPAAPPAPPKRPPKKAKASAGDVYDTRN
jgi:serine/threonine-protein kinase